MQSADDSPVPGLKLAYVGDPYTYLLYAGAWFPMVGYGTNRFSSTIGVSAPTEYTVIGSGTSTTGRCPHRQRASEAPKTPAKKGGTHESQHGSVDDPGGLHDPHLHLLDAPAFREPS